MKKRLLPACVLIGLLTATTVIGEYQRIYSFGLIPNDGAWGWCRMLLHRGKMYGTTSFGGQYNYGTIFVFDPSVPSYGKVYDFQGDPDGRDPRNQLVKGDYNNLYGVTYSGGTAAGINSGGTVFRFNARTHAYQKIYNMGATDFYGDKPDGSLVYADGKLFGTAYWGGTNDRGVMFGITKTGGGYGNLHTFSGTAGDGANPGSGLVYDGGWFYGVTEGAGSGAGSIYKVHESGSGYSVLYTFGSGGATDGRYPRGGLLLHEGILYGTTVDGGEHSRGTLFRISTNGTGYTILRSFTGAIGNGYSPVGELLMHGCRLFGVTESGGDYFKGLLYSIHTDGTAFTPLHSFTNKSLDYVVADGPIYYGDALYGVTLTGGADNQGSIYRYWLRTPRNDFDGDGKSDLALYSATLGHWYIYGTKAGAMDMAWGFPGSVPVAGDFDGDGYADYAVYYDATGSWYILNRYGETLAYGLQWGWPGAKTVSGDYDGDGADDLAVFDENTGYWYIYSVAQGSTIAWAVQWGWAGAKAVSGDYDNDGYDDLAVLDSNTGYWYVYSVHNMNTVFWEKQWGWAGCEYVDGDYSEDRRGSDFAVFDRNTSQWFVYDPISRDVIWWYGNWGYPGVSPISGDYDGDSITDLAVYDPSTYTFHIRFSSGGTWSVPWGFAGVTVVQSQY